MGRGVLPEENKTVRRTSGAVLFNFRGEEIYDLAGFFQDTNLDGDARDDFLESMFRDGEADVDGDKAELRDGVALTQEIHRVL